MLYELLDPGPHPLLSETSIKLSEELTTDGEVDPSGEPEKFLAQGGLAEYYLGLEDVPVFTGAAAEKVKRFIALQINWQLKLGMDPYEFRSTVSSHSAQGVVYRDNLPVIFPPIQKSVAQFVNSGKFKRYVRTLRR